MRHQVIYLFHEPKELNPSAYRALFIMNFGQHLPSRQLSKTSDIHVFFALFALEQSSCLFPMPPKRLFSSINPTT
jgi:hypothetical protein